MEHQHTQAKPVRTWRALLRSAAVLAVPLVLATACANVEVDSLAFDDSDSIATIARSVGEARIARSVGEARIARSVGEASFDPVADEEVLATIEAPAVTTTTPAPTTTTAPTTTIAEVVETTTTTTTTAAPETTTTTAAPTTTTTAAPAEGLVSVANASSGETYSLYASTAAQYSASEEQYWAVSMVDFSTPGGFGAEQRACLIREFLVSPDGQQLVADDIANNQGAWADGNGTPALIDSAVLDWFNTQQVCAL